MRFSCRTSVRASVPSANCACWASLRLLSGSREISKIASTRWRRASSGSEPPSPADSGAPRPAHPRRGNAVRPWRGVVTPRYRKATLPNCSAVMLLAIRMVPRRIHETAVSLPSLGPRFLRPTTPDSSTNTAKYHARKLLSNPGWYQRRKIRASRPPTYSQESGTVPARAAPGV